jgi:predicted SAM-dependent methyltransferase
VHSGRVVLTSERSMSAIHVLQKLRNYPHRRRKKLDEAARRQAARDGFARFTAPYKLHVACGNVILPGWVNIELELYSDGVDVAWDVRQPLPLPDASVEYIYHEHFLEHLTIPEALAFLRDCHRLLRPGGVLRIAMPDLSECVRQYHENDWRQPWMKQYGYEWIATRAEMINIAFREWEHKWLYDHEELHRRLREAGFTTIRDCPRLESEVPALCNLETRDGSLLVCEAVR